MVYVAFVLLALVSAASQAAPFLVSDPSADTRPTHCGLYLDGAARKLAPVVSDATGKWCKFDLVGTATGSHTALASFVIVDPIWGETEGVKSAPFVFAGPSASPPVPANIKLKP